MKIGIDIRPLQNENRFRGIGQALGYLLPELVKAGGEKHSFVFYVDERLPLPDVLAGLPDYPRISVASPKLSRRRYIRSVAAPYRPARPRRAEADVFLQFDMTLGIPATVPSVAFFHDLIPLLFRGQEKQRLTGGPRKYKNALAGNLYWQRYLRSLKQYRKARRVIAISEASKQDYHNRVDGRQAVTVVHLGVVGTTVKQTPDELKGLAGQPFLLYVGGIDFRKNVVGLIEDFYALKPNFPDLKLLAVGKEFQLDKHLGDLGWHEALQARPEYTADVLTPGFIPDPELAWLYDQAAAFVFPSRYEGFGLPILEAMQFGCPVVAYANSSITEVAGDAALLVEDGAPLAPALRELLNDKALRQSLAEKGRARAKLFSWQKTARQTLKVLEEAAGD